MVMTQPTSFATTGAGGRILIVEDDEINLSLLTAMLEEEYQIVTAEMGRQALEILQQELVDLVLLDIMMPDMDGYTVLEKIRHDLGMPDLPVIFLSALDQPQDVVRGLQMGANDYVTKPIESMVLRARVATQIKLKRLSDDRMQQIEMLERAEKLRIQLTRIASHDLKNPLHNIRIAHHLLREELKHSPLKKVLGTIELSVETMQHVIESFVDLVAIQTDTINYHHDIFSLRDVVLNVVMQYEVVANEKAITLTMGDVPGRIAADQGRMVQVASNLVSNALKYSPLSSEVCIWSEEHGNRVRLFVSDQGPGIPEAERHLLFREFSKLSPYPTAGEARTGLGLWIVRHLVRAQGGDVGAEFPEEGGSVFWVDMPAADVY